MEEATLIIQEEPDMQFDVPSYPADDDQLYAEPAGAPSAEALFAMRVAGEVARQLHESGRELRFSLTPSRSRVEVLLCDVDGVVLSRLSPSRALDIATGSPLTGGMR
jgi:hypothetical protein